MKDSQGNWFSVGDVELVSVDYDTIGLDTYGYPKVDIMKGQVRISLGWFFPDLDPDEPAYYIDIYIQDRSIRGKTIDLNQGKSRVIVTNGWWDFDFWTPFKEYGYVSHTGQWCYADGHMDFSFKHWRFRAKLKIYNFARRHIPLVQRYIDWKWYRKTKKIFGL